MDGPAVERPDGNREWHLNGQLHREDGPAVEHSDGTDKWFLDGVLHRDGGPAVERPDGTKEWYRNGSAHREDGPAVELPSGVRKWFLFCVEIGEETFDTYAGLSQPGKDAVAALFESGAGLDEAIAVSHELAAS